MSEVIEYELVQICPYEPPHEHHYPADWQFGGADGTDPRADPRWRPAVYEYFDAGLHCIHTTVVPICDDQAIDEFTVVASWGPTFNPVYLSVRRPGETKPNMLPWKYDKQTDEVNPIVSS